MNLAIDDSLCPGERKKLLELLPILYALEKYGNKKDAAGFLGISPRTIRNKVKKYKELKAYRTEVSRPNDKWIKRGRYDEHNI